MFVASRRARLHLCSAGEHAAKGATDPGRGISVRGGESSQFLYIIGYPGGGNQSFSLNDNVFLARSEDRLHYRTPTEKGSSGSPVLDPITWEAVALHHAGASTMDSLSGAGTYEANEGICLCAIRQDTKNKGSAAP
jgi:hypothetical protein